MGNQFQSISQDEDKHAYIPSWLQDINIRTELKVSNLTIPPEKLELLNIYLKDNLSLLTLTFEFNKLGDTGIAPIARALEVNKTLKKLSVISNEVGDDGMKHLSEMLRCNTTLEELDLSHNQISSVGMESLSQALKINSTLTCLTLSHNSLRDDGIKELAKGLSGNQSLKRLILNDNAITDVKGLSIAVGNNQVLESLNLSRNSINDDGMTALSDMLASNTSLVELVLSSNAFTNKGVVNLHPGVMAHGSLKSLHLNDFIYSSPIKISEKTHFLSHLAEGVDGIEFSSASDVLTSTRNRSFMFGLLLEKTDSVTFRINKISGSVMLGVASPSYFKVSAPMETGTFLEFSGPQETDVSTAKVNVKCVEGDLIRFAFEKGGIVVVYHNSKKIHEMKNVGGMDTSQVAICLQKEIEIEIVDGYSVIKGQTEISHSITDKINQTIQELKI